MSWKLSEKELEQVLSLSGEGRYSYFVKKVTDWEKVWSLRNQDGWVLAETSAGEEVVPVWPHENFAQACLSGEWKDCQAVSIDLNEWMNRWVSGMTRDKRLVGVFQTPEDKGVVVNPDQLCVDLRKECEHYE